MTDRMMKSSMTLRDCKRSRSWCQYLSGLLFWKWLEMETQLQRGTYRKWHARYWMVTRSM